VKKETAMLNKIITLAAVAALAILLIPSRLDAWGAAHVGFTHVGPGGVYHAGRTVVGGPGGFYAGGRAAGFGPYGGFYHGGWGSGVGYGGFYQPGWGSGLGYGGVYRGYYGCYPGGPAFGPAGFGYIW
jgi:hypothetical protein